MKETKTKHGNLHVLLYKNKENHQLIETHMWDYSSRIPTHYNTHKAKIDGNIQEQDKGGISYELTRNTNHMPYIGQTSRSLKQKYQERIGHIKSNELQSAYELHTYLLHGTESFLKS